MKYFNDAIYGERLKISESADHTELADNIRCLRTLLASFPDMRAEIRPHILAPGVKNPEYLINGLLADRKGIKSEEGIANAFNKALKQRCSIIVLDLDMHMSNRQMQTNKIAKKLCDRYDFCAGQITDCYVVYNNGAVRINYQQKMRSTIEAILKIFKAGL